MKTIVTDEDIKRIQLKILLEVDEFCQKNSIKYVITAGTLIGAIRHKGYIPWDDDIDICMPRCDYERFINAFESKSCYVDSFEKNDKFLFPFAKVCDRSTLLIEDTEKNSKLGINIDVFPEDGVPDGKRGIKHARHVLSLSKMLKVKQTKLSKERLLFKNVVLLIAKIILLPMTRKFIIKRIIKVAKRFEISGCSDVCNLVWGVGPKGIYPKSFFDKIIKVPFEGHLFSAISEYDAWLRKIYGDYMVLPPEAKRITHHGFKVYRID